MARQFSKLAFSSIRNNFSFNDLMMIEYFALFQFQLLKRLVVRRSLHFNRLGAAVNCAASEDVAVEDAFLGYYAADSPRSHKYSAPIHAVQNITTVDKQQNSSLRDSPTLQFFFKNQATGS